MDLVFVFSFNTVFVFQYSTAFVYWYFMSTKCETGIPIGILICVNACALLGMVLLQYLYYIKRGERTRIAYPQHKLPFTTRSE